MRNVRRGLLPFDQMVSGRGHSHRGAVLRPRESRPQNGSTQPFWAEHSFFASHPGASSSFRPAVPFGRSPRQSFRTGAYSVLRRRWLPAETPNRIRSRISAGASRNRPGSDSRPECGLVYAGCSEEARFSSLSFEHVDPESLIQCQAWFRKLGELPVFTDLSALIRLGGGSQMVLQCVLDKFCGSAGPQCPHDAVFVKLHSFDGDSQD